MFISYFFYILNLLIKMVNLTIGGGSYKGFAFLGALEYLSKNNLIDYIDNFHGCSAGAIVGILFLIGFKPIEIITMFSNLNFSELWDFDLNNIKTKYSLLGDKTFELFKNIFSYKENVNITISEFNKKYNTNINIYSFNIVKRELVNFNSNNFENLPVIIAVKASFAIPILFEPVIIENEYYVDGCAKMLSGVLNQINDGYIIKLNYENKYPIFSFSSYINSLFISILDSDVNFRENTINTINIETNEKFVGKNNFNDLTKNDIILLFNEGLIQAKKQLETISR